MIGFAELSSLAARSDPAVMVILDLALKGSAILVPGLLGALLLRRRSASAQHLFLGLTFGSLLILPFLQPVLPNWEVQVPTRISSSLVSVQEAYLGEVAEAAPLSRAVPIATLSSDRFPLRLRLVVGWMVGTLGLLAYFGLGTLRVRRLAAGARRVTNGRWLEEASRARRTLHLDRRVRLLQSDRATVPMTWGIVRPAVVLPAGAESWHASLRRDVLLHEMAHVRRRDCLMQLTVRAVCALYWFHPLVWLAAHEMRQLRERACDDEVLGAGSRASEYAAHLLQVARSFERPGLAQRVSPAFARGSDFVSRVTDLLDGDRRRGSVSRPMAVLSFVTASLLVVPLAAISPWPAEEGQEDCGATSEPAERLIRASFATGDIVEAYDGPHIRVPDTLRPVRASFTARGWCPVRFGQPANRARTRSTERISLLDAGASFGRAGMLSLERVEKKPSPALPKPAGLLLAGRTYNPLEKSASKT